MAEWEGRLRYVTFGRAIHSTHAGADNPQLAGVLNNLANVYRVQNKNAEEAATLKRVGRLLLQVGEIEKAYRILRRSQEIMEGEEAKAYRIMRRSQAALIPGDRAV